MIRNQAHMLDIWFTLVSVPGALEHLGAIRYCG
jgi:hypothetical protein